MPYEYMKDGEYDQFVFERQHYRSGGTIALPVYGNPAKDDPARPNGGVSSPTQCRIVRLHAPVEYLMISWNAVRKGGPPAAPNPYLFDANLIFKSGRVSAPVPMDMAGEGGHSWAMSGVYQYHMQAPTDLNSSMPVGITPWETQITVDQAIIPNTVFINSLLEKLPSGYVPPLFDPLG